MSISEEPPPLEEAASSWTAVVFAVVSLIFYWLFLKPTVAAPNNNNASANNNNNTPTTNRRRQNPAPRRQIPPEPQEQQRVPVAAYISEAAQELLTSCQSTPSFVKTDKDKVGLGGTRILVDGLVAFSHTKASVTEGLDINSLRAERAKILGRIATAPGMSLSSPPGKGSTLVVSIPMEHLKNDGLSRVLYVLATYYNLLVICTHKTNLTSLAEQLTFRQTVQDELYFANNGLISADTLPKHRILVASTTTGRVALVRQLSRVDLVVDFDETLQNELGRFGYKVALISDLSKLLKD